MIKLSASLRFWLAETVQMTMKVKKKWFANLLLVAIICNSSCSAKRRSIVIFNHQDAFVHAARTAVDSLSTCVDRNYRGERNCEVKVTRDESRKAWIFWFTFLPRAFDQEITVIVYDEGKSECLTY